MAYCGPRGIPLSTFLNWSQADQDAALQWQADENARCPSCGTHPQDWREDREHSHAHIRACRGCEKKQQLAESNVVANASKGARVILAHGPTAACPQCNPKD